MLNQWSDWFDYVKHIQSRNIAFLYRLTVKFSPTNTHTANTDTSITIVKLSLTTQIDCNLSTMPAGDKATTSISKEKLQDFAGRVCCCCLLMHETTNLRHIQIIVLNVSSTWQMYETLLSRILEFSANMLYFVLRHVDIYQNCSKCSTHWNARNILYIPNIPTVRHY